MKTLYIFLFVIALASCITDTKNSSRSYNSNNNLYSLKIDIQTLDTISPKQELLEIIEVFEAQDSCGSITYADFYICTNSSGDTIQVLSPCQSFIHQKGTYAEVFSVNNYNSITINNSNRTFNSKIKTIIGRLLVPIE